MAVSPIVQATKKWAKITNEVGGGPAAAAVQKLDMQKINAGSTGLSQQEALTAISSASRDQQAIQKSPKGGLNPFTIAGNAVKDVGSMVAGAAIGAVHLAEHPGRDIKGAIKAVPATIQEVTHPKQAGLAGEIQAVAGSELGRFIPGAYVAGNLAKGAAGLKTLEQHPGFAAADLLPYASKLLPALARIGNPELTIAGKGSRAVVGGVEAGSTAEALARGQVGRATLRAASDAIVKISGGKISPSLTIHGVLGGYADLVKQSKVALHLFNFTHGAYLAGDEGGKAMAHDLYVSQHPDFLALEPDKQASFTHLFNQLPEKPKEVLPALKAMGLDRLATSAYRKQGILAFHGALHNLILEGTPRTMQDVLEKADTLPPGLRKKFIDGYVEHDPWAFELQGLHGHPSIPQELQDKVGSVLPKSLHDLLYKEGGLHHGMLYEGMSEAGRELAFAPPGAFRKASESLTSIFKGSLFLRPSIVAKIGIGGLIQMVGDGYLTKEMINPENIHDALQMVNNGDSRLMMGGWANKTGDQVQAHVVGQTAGRLVQGIKGAENRVIELTSGMQRALTYITQHKAALDAGTSELGAKMAAEEALNRVFMTTASMTPLEQTIVRQIMPFYGFQKHIFEHLAHYPADHPFKLNILSKIADQETNLHASGLPQMFQEMMFLGTPDKKGNVQAVDVRGFNPFKSFANDFTLAGFASSLNPVLSYGLERIGVKQGRTSPYATLSVDPQTGNLISVPPPSGSLISHLIPQLGTIENILGFNNRLKTLKQQNPSAYRAYLLQAIGIPIAQTVSIPGETAKASDNLYRVAQQDVSNFLRTGDFGNISGYNILPYQGRWFTPRQLEQLYQQAAALPHPKGMAIKDLLPKLRKVPATPPPIGV